MPADHEIRCYNKLHGIVVNDDVIEIKCNSRFCGASDGWNVFHRFSSKTGELLDTQTFRNPPTPTSIRRD